MRNFSPQSGHWPARPCKLLGPFSRWPLGQRKTMRSAGSCFARCTPLLEPGVTAVVFPLPPAACALPLAAAAPADTAASSRFLAPFEAAAAISSASGTTNAVPHLGHLP